MAGVKGLHFGRLDRGAKAEAPYKMATSSSACASQGDRAEMPCFWSCSIIG